MRIRVGCEFGYEAAGPIPSVWRVRPRPQAGPLVTSTWQTTPSLPSWSFVDGFGNLCDRVTMGVGATEVRFEAVVEVPPHYDEIAKDAPQLPVEQLPDHVLDFLLPSRYCFSDLVLDRAWELFGGARPGWDRVQAICDWVHTTLRYSPSSTTPVTTAIDVLGTGAGVCRDFAHLSVTFCRALNIPARYVSGYIPDVGVDPVEDPMDFCSWFEAWLGDRWWTFDARNNSPRMGRVVIGYGRDAADVAMVTTYGDALLQRMGVWADEEA